MADIVDLEAIRRQVDSLRQSDLAIGDQLKSGGGGGTSDGMETRVARLETHMEYVRSDLHEIKGDLKEAVTELRKLPSRSDLNQWKLTWTGLVVAAIAIICGGIIGGLGWLETRAARIAPPVASVVQPIVIQMPPAPAAR